MFIDISLIFIDLYWFSMGFQWFSRIFNDFQGFSKIFNDFHWFSLIVNGFQGKRGQCWTPVGSLRSLGSGVKQSKIVFRLGLPPKTGPVSRPDRAPSAAIGPHRRPSAACAWELRSRTGLPPQTPPDFYSSNIQGWRLVLFSALTRRRSRRISIKLILF